VAEGQSTGTSREVGLKDGMIQVTRIYCFNNGPKGSGFEVVALANDKVIARNWSTEERYLKEDIGIGSQWGHEIYSSKFPEGWELVWLEDETEIQQIIRSKKEKKTFI